MSQVRATVRSGIRAGAFTILSRWRQMLVGSLVMLYLPVASFAADQKLTVRSGWNLIALNVEPANPAPEVVFASLIQQNAFEVLWSYDAGSGAWASFPQAPDSAGLSMVRSGVGYWLKIKAPSTASITFTINGGSSLPQAPLPLVAGWNLLGFVLNESTAYERVLNGLPVRQIWTFDATPSVRKFRGVVYGAAGTTPVPEDFNRLEVGRGYWVLLGEVGSVEPELVSGLPPDVDVPPLLPEAGGDPGEQLPFTELSPGDLDAGRDGFYDRPPSQRAIDFGDFADLVRLTIANRGRLSLAWRVRVENPSATPWLRLRFPDSPLCRGDCPTEVSGAVTTDTAEIDVVVDRSGIGPGMQDGRLIVESNGMPSAFPFEPTRYVDVHMTVPPLDGDYELSAQIETVNGEAADLASPTYYLGLYSDADGLKGILDGRRSLLLPEYCIGGSAAGTACGDDSECPSGRCEHHVRLAGRMYESGTNRFQISGSFELPESPDGQAGCPNPKDDNPAEPPRDNPFDVALRRDITLRGDRPGLGDATLGPQDLQGEYFETIRNVLGDPIQIQGRFTARRLSPAPTAIDGADKKDTPSQPVIPDGDSNGKEFSKTITDNLLLSEVDVLVDISHPAPEDLKITLESPSHEVVVLRERGHRGPAGKIVYDETESTPNPMAGLETFVGDLSGGTWKLKVIDYDPKPDSRGLLREWELRLRGTRVNDIGGTVSSAPPGTQVVLSGCGHVYQAVTDAMGQYLFRNLIDCRYRLAIADPAYRSPPSFVSLQGSNRTGANAVNLTASPAPTPGAVVTNCAMPAGSALCNPEDGTFRLSRLTTSGGAGLLYDTNGSLFQVSTGPCPGPVSCFSYLASAAYFDLDQPPYNAGADGCAASSPACLTGTCCREDTNAFLRDPVAPHTIGRGSNAEIDVPLVGDIAQGQKLTINIGLPVIGVSYGGAQKLAIGVMP